MQTSDGLGCVPTWVYEVYCAENQARLSFTVCQFFKTIKPKIKHNFLLLIPGNHTLEQGRRGIIPSLSTQLPFVSPSPPPWENSPPKKKLHCRHLNKRFLRLTALPPWQAKIRLPLAQTQFNVSGYLIYFRVHTRSITNADRRQHHLLLIPIHILFVFSMQHSWNYIVEESRT